MLRVRLAGNLRIEADGRALEAPRSRRARALLAYLAAHRGPHSRGHLAARFWPDVLDDSARASLRAALTELRQALGAHADRLVATRDTVALDGVWVDIRDEDPAPVGVLLTDMDDDWVLELRSEHEDRVARTRGADAVAAITPPAALTRAAEQPFVGRAAELQRLEAAWAGVRAGGSRRLLLLAGEPGIGKTRLALRFARAALDDGAAVLLGRCSEDPLAPYEPFADVVRQIGVEAARALAGTAELGRVLGEAHGGPAQDAGARHRLFSAVDDMLGAVAERRPVVLVLDDLQWADRPTLLLLGFVLRSSRRAPLLAIGTYRDTEIGRRTPLTGALAELRRDGGAERIGLRGLAPQEIGELAAEWVGAREAARVTPHVHERTGGNAFFVEEVLRGLAGDESEVPESVRHAVGVRLARLGDAADELLGTAAVIGQVVDVDLLGAVAGLEPAAVEPLVDELLDAHLLRLSDGRATEFTHALVREAVLAELSPLRRARLHRTAAEALTGAGEEHHLEEIAHHLSEAGDARAAQYLQRAGEHALAMLAYEEAAELFARALEVAADKDALLLARGDALLRAGEPQAARECFSAAAAIARAAHDPVLLARAALGHAGLAVTIIDFDQAAVARLEEALAALGDRELILRSQLLARLAVESYYAPSRDRTEAVSSEAVAVAQRAGDARAVANALNARHVALWRPDRLRERIATADAMIEAARTAGDRQLELQARNWRVVDLFEAGDVTWRAEVRRHGELATALRMPSFAWYTPLWEAVEAVNAGRFAEAAELRERARAQGGRAGDDNAHLFAEMLIAAEAMLRDELETLDRALMEDKIAHSPAGMAWRASYAWELAATGHADAAREQLAIVSADDFAALPFDANWPSALGESAEACIVLGDAGPAAAVYARLLPYADVTITAGRAVMTYGSTQRLLGGLAAVLGRTQEAVERHEAAIRFNEAAGFGVWAERSRAALGHIRPRRDDERRVPSGP